MSYYKLLNVRIFGNRDVRVSFAAFVVSGVKVTWCTLKACRLDVEARGFRVPCAWFWSSRFTGLRFSLGMLCHKSSLRIHRTSQHKGLYTYRYYLEVPYYTWPYKSWTLNPKPWILNPKPQSKEFINKNTVGCWDKDLRFTEIAWE